MEQWSHESQEGASICGNFFACNNGRQQSRMLPLGADAQSDFNNNANVQ